MPFCVWIYERRSGSREGSKEKGRIRAGYELWFWILRLTRIAAYPEPELSFRRVRGLRRSLSYNSEGVSIVTKREGLRWWVDMPSVRRWLLLPPSKTPYNVFAIVLYSPTSESPG